MALNEKDQDLEQARLYLQDLPEVRLPASLTAESLFERLDELEQKEAESQQQQKNGKVLFWKTWRPVLSYAAVFILLVAVYYGMGIDTQKPAQLMSSDAAVSQQTAEAALPQAQQAAPTEENASPRAYLAQEAPQSDVKRDNANIDGNTAMGSMLQIGTAGAKAYNEAYLLTPEQAKAYREGDIHIHDFDFYSLTTTCTQIDIINLFDGGFSTGHGFLREPQSIQSYAALAAIAIQSNQNDQHGGQSIPNFDYGMALGVAKTFRKAYTNKLMEGVEDYLDTEDEKEGIDAILKQAKEKTGFTPRLEDGAKEFDAAVAEGLTERYQIPQAKAARLVEVARHRATRKADRDTYQAMEGFVHNLNTMHSRAGAQTPFSSINYGTDTSPEGRMVIKNILLATDAGLGHGETCIFPIHVFKVKEGVNYNEGDPNYDLFKLSCKVSAKRLFPNYIFLDAPFNLQYYKPGHPETEVATMGCRTRVMGNVYDPTREISYSRGNLSFTSINLPRLAIESNHDEKLFYQKLDKMLDLVANQLLDRFEIQAAKRVYNFPFLMGQGVWLDSDKLGPNDEVREVLKHGTLSIGFIGLAETLTALYGHHQRHAAVRLRG